MSEKNIAFPQLTEGEAAQAAAALADAACGLMGGQSGISQEYALQISRRIFAEQYRFLREGKWDDEKGI